MQLGYHTITWGGVGAAPAGVTSVKDLYYRAGGSMEQAIHDIGAAGYAGVEMFDGNLVDYADRPDELTWLLREAGVELVSVYTGANFLYADALPDEMHRIRIAAELAAQFQAQTLTVGGGARRASGTTDGDYDALAQSLDAVVDLAESFGLTASFHPHLGTIVESPDEVDTVLARSRIRFCPDTAHLAAGGGDPAELIRRHAGRVNHVHLKDLAYETTSFQPLGKGELDLPDVLAALGEADYDDWLIVELDSYDGDPREAAESSRSYLETLLR